MSCTSPVSSIFLRPKPGQSPSTLPASLPCGRCDDCRMARSADLSMRACHEASTSDFSYFVTLTYAKNPGAVLPRDSSLFIKRLRRALSGFTVRYILSGEYGDRTGRPHYHLLIFLKSETPCVSALPAMPGIIASCWDRGIVDVQPFSPATAAYVCRYTLKKRGTDGAFSRMSTRPGIGFKFLMAQGKCDALTNLRLAFGGAARRLPAYYRRVLRREFPEQYAAAVEVFQRECRDRSLALAAKRPQEFLASVHPDRRYARAALVAGDKSRLKSEF